MAQIKNFGIRGVGSSVQYGKGGGRVEWADDHFSVVAAGGAAAQLRVPTSPEDNNDATSKAYVDSIAAGLDPKASVRAATTATDGNIGTGFTAGGGANGVNDRITGVENTAGDVVIDDVTLNDGDRVLVKNQSAPAQNGVYVYSASADEFVRATDFDGSPENEVDGGEFMFVEEGTLYADTGWVLSTDAPITFGTTPLTFTQFSAAGVVTAGNGLTKTGNEIRVGDSDTIATSTDAVFVNSSATANQILLSSGVAGTAATYGALPLGDPAATSGQLPQSRGGLGTDISGFGENSLLKMTSGGGVSELGIGAADQVLVSDGEDVAYGYVQALRDADGDVTIDTTGDGGANHLTVDLGTNVTLDPASGYVLVTGDYASDPGSLPSNVVVTKSYVDTLVSGSETGLQGELDDTQAAIGLSSDGTLAPWAGTTVYLSDSGDLTIVDALETLDGAISDLQAELDLSQLNAGLEEDGTYAANAGTNYIGSSTSLKNADEDLDAALKLVSDELDLSQLSAGLETDGTLGTWGAANYLGDSSDTSLKQGIITLDSEMFGLHGRLLSLEGAPQGTDLENSIDAIIESVGLNTDGSKPDFTSTNYILATDDFYTVVNKIDTALSTLADDVAVDVRGVAGEITVTEGSAGEFEISIDDAYVGQASITTLGTVTTGVWNGTEVATTHGGTGLTTLGTTGQILQVNAGADGYEFADLDATNVTFVGTSAGIAATNLQDALEEVDGRLDTVESSLDNLTAADVAFVPAGAIEATDVQAAIAELDDEVIRHDGTVTYTANQPMGGFTLTGLGAPTDPAHAATKGYVDGLIAGGVNYRGALDAGADPLPTDPNTGDMYRIEGEGDFSGTFAGDLLNVGDFIIYSGSGGWDRLDSVDVTVAGTTDRVSVTGNDDSGYTVDIAAGYVGQASITTVGTIGTGTWQGTVVDEAYGGTGESTYAAGDLLVGDGTGLTKVTIGAADTVLVSDGTTAGWEQLDASVVAYDPASGSSLTATNVADAIDELEAAVAAGSSGLGDRIDDLNTALGVTGDDYTAITGSNYLNATETFREADLALDAALKDVADDLANLSQNRIEDADGNTFVDTALSGDLESVVIGAGGDVIATFASAGTAGDEAFTFTNATGEVRVEASNAAGTGDVDIRLVPQGNGQVFIGEADQDGTIQADNDRSLILLGGDSTGVDGGNVYIGGGAAGSGNQGNVEVEGNSIYLNTATLVTVPNTYDPTGNDYALVNVAYVDGAIETLTGVVDDLPFLTVNDISGDYANSRAAQGGNGIAFTPSSGTFTADTDEVTITNLGGDGDQLAVRGGTAGQILVSAGGAADAAWGFVSALRASDGDAIFTASEAGDDAVLTATGSATNIDIILTPKGTGFVLAPSGYDMSAADDLAFSTKGYVDDEIAAVETAAQTAAVGSVRAVTANITPGGVVNLGSAIIGRVFRITVHVGTIFDAPFSIGPSTDTDLLMTGAEIDETAIGASVADVNQNFGSSTQLVADTTGSTVGAGYAVIEYVVGAAA